MRIELIDKQYRDQIDSLLHYNAIDVFARYAVHQTTRDLIFITVTIRDLLESGLNES